MNTNHAICIIGAILVFVSLILYLIFRKRNQVNLTDKSGQKRNELTNKKTQNDQPIESKQKNRIDSQPTEEKYITEKKISREAKIVIPLNEIQNKTVKPEKEEYSKEKYIGYKPINIFAQTEPLHYPYVLIPKPNSVIKFPRKGKRGRKGYKEEAFKLYLDKYFRSNFQVFDDRFILVKNSLNPFEPDFTLIDEKNDINIFVDIEIDEPYEGINDIQKRKPTHFQYSDINRNNAFINRGWIVIRFAEIQVHKEAESCCKFIADVLRSINPNYIIPEPLAKYRKIEPLRQWTKEESEKWSTERYREKYLGIESFGTTKENNLLTDISETELGEKIEELIKDDNLILTEVETKAPKTEFDKIHSAINSNKYLSFFIRNEKTIVKPLKVRGSELTAFCYIKNKEIAFLADQIRDIQIKNNYYTFRATGPSIGLDQITNAINTAITYQKYIRIRYTRSSWTNIIVDYDTGELFTDKIEAEESLRTINDVQLSINVLKQEHIEAYKLNTNYITAYCNKREAQRTFRFDRIGEIEILDL